MAQTTMTGRLAEVIREAAGEQGKSLRAIAEATNIPPSTLSRSLRGGRPLDTEELNAIALFLGTTMTALVTAAEDVAA